jgi:hypothetical protein
MATALWKANNCPMTTAPLLGSASAPPLDRSAVSVVSSFDEADRLDREYWWSLTPQARMQALELSRAVAYGYGNNKPIPRFQSVLEIAELEQC